MPDSETLELLGEFLSESGEQLSRADELLVLAAREGASPEQVNELFRGFHTIKGVSSFLGVEPITRLAHATESLLNRVRASELRLEAECLDAVFDASALMRELLDGLRAHGQSRFRLWSAASSSGEEVYTMAMTAAEVLGLEADWRILGTDLSTRVLATARAGVYGPQSVTPIPAALRAKYLQRAEGDTWRVIDALRRKTAFARLNLSTPPSRCRGP